MNRAAIEAYAAGGPTLAAGITGLTPAELNSFPVANTWSIQQIVLHLMDSDLIASDRMKRIITMENPAIIGYDETAFSAGLFYDQLDAQLAADLFARNRLMTAEILRRVPDEKFTRFGTHNERGRVTLGQMVEMYVQHLEHHLKFLRYKRQLLGKPL